MPDVRHLVLPIMAGLALSGCVGDATPGPASSATSPAGDATSSSDSSTELDATPSTNSTPRPTALAEPLAFMDALVPDDGAWDSPYGVDVAPDGTTWVLDAGNHRVLAFDAAGAQVVEVGGQGSDEGQLDTLGFGSLAIGSAAGGDPSGDGRDYEVHVIDNGNRRVQVLGPDGAVRRTWPLADLNGDLERAIGIAVDEAGIVHVTDDEVAVVSTFDGAGQYLQASAVVDDEVEVVGADDYPGLEHPTGIDVADGVTWVADFEARVVAAFDGTDRVAIHEIPGPIGTTGTPEGIVVVDDGRVWVTSYRGGEVLEVPVGVTTPDGQDPDPWPLVAGGDGTGDGTFQAPVDLAVGPDGTLVVTDQAANSVQRFRPAS